MNTKHFNYLYLTLALVVTWCLPLAAKADTQRVGEPPVRTASAQAGMVVCETELAAQIGADVLRKGGNAIDASVAVAFALAVTWPEAGNIAGGGFMLIAAPGQPIEGLDYREVAPEAATQDLYRSGETRFKAKAVGVPGTVGGLATAHAKFGQLPWKDLVRPSATLAADGFVVDGDLAASLNYVLTRKNVRENNEGRHTEFRRVYTHPDDRPWRVGDTLTLPDLAETLEQIAEEGADAFYHGPIAEDMASHIQDAGGIITSNDLANYEAVWRTPTHGTFQGFDLYTMAPPSSGGICVPQIMGMLERRKVTELERWSPETLHVMAEAMRRSFRDRAAYLGDPDFIEIPAYLLEDKYLDELAATIDAEKATLSASLVGEIELVAESPDTTHFSIVDRNGLAVSNTYTLEAIYGSRVVIPGRGILLNNEMGDFNWIKGQTNTKGKIGTDANLIAPGKRMLSSMSPTIVQRDGRTVLVVGSPGGRTIINTVSQVLLNHLGFEMSLAESVEVPRLHHQWFPDRIQFESYFADTHPELMDALGEMGHATHIYRSTQGSVNAIEAQGDGTLVGVADWRRGASAAGVEAVEPVLVAP
ncbi:MAG: gamma-glutamyltransferase [Planctomycetota bacterium]